MKHFVMYAYSLKMDFGSLIKPFGYAMIVHSLVSLTFYRSKKTQMR